MSSSLQWPELFEHLMSGERAERGHITWAMREIMTGHADDAQIAAFAILMGAQKISAEELAAAADVMLERAHLLSLPEDLHCVDVVGTGGDRAHTLNFSTMAAVVVAASGVTVMKHGNRAASSKCGSADVLRGLGVNTEADAESVLESVKHANIGFCCAPVFHPEFRHAAGVRRSIRVPTIFNFLGPLANPAQPEASALGCFDLRMSRIMAEVLSSRGTRGVVMRSEDGLDEFSVTAPTRFWIINSAGVRECTIDAVDLGVPRAPLASLQGGKIATNVARAQQIFAGEKSSAAQMVALNAAAGLVAAEDVDHVNSASELEDALREQYQRAYTTLASGAANHTLAAWAQM